MVRLLLRKLTALALVLTPSACAAAMDRQLSSTLRGRSSDETTATMVKLQATCQDQDGYDDGWDDVQQYWKNTARQNCDNVWRLEDEANIMKDNYPGSSAYSRCARDGIDDAVADIEKACLEDDSSQCTDLGEAAAELVVMNGWCSPRNQAGAYGTPADAPDYKAECKEAAVRICEGNIHTVVDDWCPDTNMMTSDLRTLQNDCEDQVDEMVGVDNGGGGQPQCGNDSVDDERPRPVRTTQSSGSVRYRFNLVKSNSKCADKNDDLYEWGQFSNVKEFSDCAEACINDVRESLLDTFRGYDWDCYRQTCNCLYDRGTLDSRNSVDFTRTNRNDAGEGSITRTVRSTDFYCAKLVGAEFSAGEVAGIA